MTTRSIGSTSGTDFSGTTLTDLSAWLSAAGVDVTSYGTGSSKPLTLLLTEIQDGETALSVVDGKPLRVVNVLNVVLRNKNSGKSLVEAYQILPTGYKRPRNMPLSEKMLPAERWQDAVPRAITEELGPILDSAHQKDIKILEETYNQRVEFKESQSYPGLHSKYICHRVEAQFPGLPDTDFETSEEREDGTLIHCWEWR